VNKSRLRHQVVIVGAGFAGHAAARELTRLAGRRAEVTVINPADYFLYLPLIPQVAGGLLEPRHVCVPLAWGLRGTRMVVGTVTAIDPRQKTVTWAAPKNSACRVRYDRLILAAGSISELLPVPGAAEYAHGFRSIAEAIYLRDHIICQLELAAAADSADERQARRTFVVAGTGYTGTEVAAQGQLLTRRLARVIPGLAGQTARWILLDTAPRLLPELSEHLSPTGWSY
jgi:NADH dehydrogenase